MSVCISCGSLLSEDIVFVGNQYPSAVYVESQDSCESFLTKESLNLCRCTNEECSLIQLSKPYDLSYVFEHYPYESGSTAGMKAILSDLLSDGLSFVQLNDDDVVLDIGGNDGTMLSLLDRPLKARVNIDAASNVDQVVQDVNYYFAQGRFNSDIYSELNLGSPKLIFSTAMFYHLQDPFSFTRDVANIMSNDSVWILQMTYAGTMLEHNVIDNIVHEHVAYYTLKSLEYLLKSCGLYIIEAKLVESYGGSLRVFISKNLKYQSDTTLRNDYYKILDYEEKLALNSLQALHCFNAKLLLIRDMLRDLILSIPKLSSDPKICGFGASTKGNMLLQLAGLSSNEIVYILDNSPKKIGKKTTGSLIPIVDEREYLDAMPQNILILPYYYKDIFIRIIQNNLKPGHRANVIIPLPYPKILSLGSI